MSQNVGDRKLGLSPRVIAMNYFGITFLSLEHVATVSPSIPTE